MTPVVMLLASEGHRPPPLVDIDHTAWLQLGIFLLLFVVLTRFVFKPYLALKSQRYDRIEGAKVAADAEQQQAAEQLAQYEHQIATVRKEAALARLERRKEGDLAAQDTLSRARHRAEEQLNAARARITDQIPAVQSALEKQIQPLVDTAVSRILR